MTHVKLLSIITIFILVICSFSGVFGALIEAIVGWTLIALVLALFYFALHEMFFGDDDRSW